MKATKADTLQGKLVPYEPGRLLDWGGNEAREIRGPILYVREEGAIFYRPIPSKDTKTIILIIDSFENNGFLLDRLARQIEGRIKDGYERKEYNLSNGIRDIDISKREFNRIADEAGNAYAAWSRLNNGSVDLIERIQKRLSLRLIP